MNASAPIASLVYRSRNVRSGGNWQLIIKRIAAVVYVDLRVTDADDRTAAVAAAEEHLERNYRPEFLELVERSWPAVDSPLPAGAPVDLSPVDRATATLEAAGVALTRCQEALETVLAAAVDGSARIPSGVEAVLLDALRGLNPEAAARFLLAPGADWTVG
jgi:hypothetical protein